MVTVRGRLGLPAKATHSQMMERIDQLRFDRNNVIGALKAELDQAYTRADRLQTERDDARDKLDYVAGTCAALLDYLRGDWHDCSHNAIGKPGCPTCEARWDEDARIVVQAHRDRSRALADQETIDRLTQERNEAARQRDALQVAYSRGQADLVTASCKRPYAEDLARLEHMARLVVSAALPFPVEELGGIDLVAQLAYVAGYLESRGAR